MILVTKSAYKKSLEEGQSIVILTFALIVLLILVGLAVDLGFGYVRSSQFARAVDAATKAGVFDVHPVSMDTSLADSRAQQFLTINGWPASTLIFTDSLITIGRLGYPHYSFTATWPVETYFMRLLGIDGYRVTRSATAGFHAQAEMYTPTQFRRGHVRQASQFIVGDLGCTEAGDPVSPLNKTRNGGSVANAEYILFQGTHHYRIRIPSSYTETQSHVQIQLFDPDTYNAGIGSLAFPITHTVEGGQIPGLPTQGSCSPDDSKPCFISTGENIEPVGQNPFWIQRADEIFDSSCEDTSDRVSTDVTTFALYYLDDDNDKINIATYESNPGNAASTDLKWITPSGFTVPISSSLTLEEDARVIFLDVTSTGGFSRNGWDIWAGPPSAAASLDDNVNFRNIELANSPTTAAQEGVTVLALGRMPIQPVQTNSDLRLVLSQIDISFGGGSMYVSLFDFDPSGTPPFTVNFTLDSINTDVFNVNGTVSSSPGVDDLEATCNDGTSSCDAVWTNPQWGMSIPGEEGRVVFFGGNLIATYSPGGDAHTISMSITDGRPFLTE